MRSLLRAAALTTTVITLAACGSGSGDRGIGRMLMGPPGPAQETDFIGERPDPLAAQRPCPAVIVRDGTGTLRVPAGGAEDDARSLRYQGGIDRTARECTFDGAGVTMKIGVTGRLILGPAGQPGNYTLPIRMAVLHRGGEPAWSELFNVPVTVLPGEGNARFSHVAQNVHIPLAGGESSEAYVVYVGFDELGR